MRVHQMLLAAVAAAALGFSANADLTGTVKLDGKPGEAKAIDMSGVKECNDLHSDPVYEESVVVSESGELKNVLIWISKEDSPDLTGEVPSTPAMLDQTGCVYVPHVLPMMVGQKFVVKNSDSFLHNVHTLSTVNPSFNKGQATKNDGEEVASPQAPEDPYRVKCDVHPWMSAYIVVLDHPFFSATGDDGKFAIKGLPEGEYTVVAWHEKFGKLTGKAKVDGSGNGTCDFTFKSEGAMAPRVGGTVEVTAKTDDGCKSGGACCGASKGAALTKAAEKSN